MALNWFRQRDIERMDVNDIPEEFVNYLLLFTADFDHDNKSRAVTLLLCLMFHSLIRDVIERRFPQQCKDSPYKGALVRLSR